MRRQILHCIFRDTGRDHDRRICLVGIDRQATTARPRHWFPLPSCVAQPRGGRSGRRSTLHGSRPTQPQRALRRLPEVVALQGRRRRCRHPPPPTAPPLMPPEIALALAREEPASHRGDGSQGHRRERRRAAPAVSTSAASGVGRRMRSRRRHRPPCPRVMDSAPDARTPQPPPLERQPRMELDSEHARMSPEEIAPAAPLRQQKAVAKGLVATSDYSARGREGVE